MSLTSTQIHAYRLRNPGQHSGMGKIIALGEALIDFMPRETGVSLAEVSGFIKAPGGAPANVAVCASRLGAKAMVITQLGTDAFGDYLTQIICEAGVDVSAILRTDEAPTSLAFVSLKADGERDFLFYRSPAADLMLEPESIEERWFSSGDILHFCSVALAGEPMRRSHSRAIELAQKRGMMVSFDVNLRFPLWNDAEELRRMVMCFLPGVSLLKAGHEELSFLTGEDHDAGIAKILELVPSVLVTYGKNGAALFSKGRRVFHPGYDTPAVDTTGAGDAFIGSFLTSLLESQVVDVLSLSDGSVYKMLERAHAVASLVVASKGAMNAMPNMDQVNRFIAEHHVSMLEVSGN